MLFIKKELLMKNLIKLRVIQLMALLVLLLVPCGIFANTCDYFDVEVHPNSFSVNDSVDVEITAMDSGWNIVTNYNENVSLKLSWIHSYSDLATLSSWYIYLTWWLSVSTTGSYNFLVSDLLVPTISWSAAIVVNEAPVGLPLEFDSAMEGIFPGFIVYKSLLWYRFGMNSFFGLIFPTEIVASTGTEVSVGSDPAIDCNEQINGLYYNGARGNIFWPLDMDSLSGLQSIHSSYSGLELTGGLFLDCSGINVSGVNNVYGQIIYTLNGAKSAISAWVEMDFTGNSFFTGFANNLIISKGRLSWFLHDTFGGIAEVVFEEPIEFSWSIQFVDDFWDPMEYYMWFTDYNHAYIELISNQNIYAILSWDITTEYLLNFSWDNIQEVQFNTWDWPKIIKVIFMDNERIVVDTQTINVTLDTTPPSIPTPTNILSWAVINMAETGIFTLGWNASVDWSGIWLNGHYEIDIYTSTWSLLTWILVVDTLTWSTHLLSDFGTGKFKWKVKSRDRLGNAVISEDQYFSIVDLIDVEPDVFSFEEEREAPRNSVEHSSFIVVSGLGSGVAVSAEISRGIMFIDNHLVWQTGLVKNGSLIWIELASSDAYNSVTSSQLKIWSKTARFVITTEHEDDDEYENYLDYYDDNELSLEELLLEKSLSSEVVRIFMNLKDIYSSNKTKQKNFFYTLNIMIKDQINILEMMIDGVDNKKKEYNYVIKIKMFNQLYSLVENYLINELWFEHSAAIDTKLLDVDGYYTAQDWTKYKVYKDPAKWFAYTVKWLNKFFPTIETLIDYLEKDWNDDTSINQNMVAPNGKSYRVVFDPATATYTSPDFSEPKNFTDRNDMLKTIIVNNPGDEYRNHDKIDTSRWMKYYRTTSGKEYEIRKATKLGKVVYFSYWTVQPNYFNKVSDLLKLLEVMNWWSAALITEWVVTKFLNS